MLVRVIADLDQNNFDKAEEDNVEVKMRPITIKSYRLSLLRSFSCILLNKPALSEIRLEQTQASNR